MQRAHKRRSAAQWSELIAQWTRSGDSAERFAAGVGVKLSTLRWWQSQLGKSGTPERTARRAEGRSLAKSATFAEVQVVESPRREGGFVEVVTRGGHVIRVHGEVDAEALQSVFEALGRC